VARPSKLTPETRDQLCKLLQQGATLQAASEACGLTYHSVQAWRLRGENELKNRHAGKRAKSSEDMFITFLTALKKARATAEVGLQGLILQSAKGGRELANQTIEKFHTDGTLKERRVIKTLEAPVWTAAAWLLERSFGYTRTDRLILESIVKEKIDVTMSSLEGKLSPEAYVELQQLFTSELTETRQPEELN
jgi:hypothetical protein